MGKLKVDGTQRLPLWQPLWVRDFLLLYIGESVSLLGDQFYLVALPWLTIQLTNSPLSLGTVLMAAAIPRAVFLLIGGVVSDRLPPRLIMLVANAVRAVLTALLTALVIFQGTQLWHLYLFAISFGIIDGFFIPATKSIIPSLVPRELLAASNALSMGTTQLLVPDWPCSRWCTNRHHWHSDSICHRYCQFFSHHINPSVDEKQSSTKYCS